MSGHVLRVMLFYVSVVMIALFGYACELGSFESGGAFVLENKGYNGAQFVCSLAISSSIF